MNRVDFLLDKGGPVIRYRTLTELVNEKDLHHIKIAEQELMKSTKTRQLLKFLGSKDKLHDFNGVHGSSNHHLENILPMVLEYGVRKGFLTFDAIMEPVLKRLKKRVFKDDHVFSQFIKIIIVPFLYKAGYRNKWILEFIKNRLDTVYNFTARKYYDIYDDTSEYKGVPQAFKNRKVIKPKLYEGGYFKFPLIYDLYGFSELIKHCDVKTRNKIESIIDYTLQPEYNDLYDGYGILWNGNTHYYAMGWDAKLPKYSEEEPLTSIILHRLELMAHFKKGIEHKWFKNVRCKLEDYKTEYGTYRLPKESLKEKVGCYVKGNHMGLGENRRTKHGYELESTFRMLKIEQIVKETISRG